MSKALFLTLSLSSSTVYKIQWLATVIAAHANVLPFRNNAYAAGDDDRDQEASLSDRSDRSRAERPSIPDPKDKCDSGDMLSDNEVNKMHALNVLRYCQGF